MKTMTCKQLGGTCDKEFHADTFESMAQQSKNHVMEMIHQGEKEHLEAMNKMQEMMKSPDKMKYWFESKRTEFEALSEDI